MKNFGALKSLSLILFFFILFCCIYFLLKIYVYAPTDNFLSYINNTGNVLNLRIPSNLEFCGEKIPSGDLKVKQGIEKEFYSDRYWKSNSEQLFARTQRWFPVIEPILKSENIPSDFKYLAVIESHLSNVTSPAGAAGFWQLAPSTAYYYGLEVNDFIDERYHVEKSTHAACKHIKDAYAYFKNWTLTAAAYNRGIAGIINALKNQNKKDYYHLLLNPETGAFVYRILAFKTLLSSPSHFGINKKNGVAKHFTNYKSIRVDSSITHLSHFATHVKSSTAMIKKMNPWILKDIIINPAKKIYLIRIPKKPSPELDEMLADIATNRINFATPSEVVSENDIKTIDSLTEIKKTIYYEVKVEEPLKNLADFFKVNEAELREWNNMKENQKAVKGQTLIIHK